MFWNSSGAEQYDSHFHQTRRYWHLLAALAAACSTCGILAFPGVSRAHYDATAVPTTAAPAKLRTAMEIMVDTVAAEPEAEALQAYFTDPHLQHRVSFGLKLNARIVGAASTYNPYKPGDRSGGTRTASGEPYEANGWAAAVQINYRGAFAGVRYGRNYRPAFALITSGEKSVVVKINDVGPLLPGRVIDLTERTMRFFDATLDLGVLRGVTVTPLAGEHWRAGPVDGGLALSMAGDLLDDTLH